MTLSQAVAKIKLLLKIAVVVFVILIAITLGRSIKDRIAPTPPPQPTVSFGKLPNILFPKSVTDSKITYSLNTITGDLPAFPNVVKVYKIVAKSPSFFALENAKNRVEQLGFTSPTIRLSEELYQWTDETLLSRRIVVNVRTFDFTLSSLFLSDPIVESAHNLPDEKTAIDIARSFLSNISSFPSDIDATTTKTSLFSIAQENLIPATSKSEAKIIRVDFFQKSVDGLPIYYQSPLNSNIYVLIAATKPPVVEASFYHRPISNESATYPIKTANQAFADLVKGNAYIAFNPSNSKTVSVSNVLLGFYLAKEGYDFLVPIFIFEGNNFFAYVPAITDQWIDK